MPSPAVILLGGLLLALAACESNPPPGEAPTRAQVVDILETYVHGLEVADPTRVPLAPDVLFENPSTRQAGRAIHGEDAVREFYEDTGQRMGRIHVERHVIDGSDACIILEWESGEDVDVPAVHCFRVEDGALARIRIFTDGGFSEG